MSVTVDGMKKGGLTRADRCSAIPHGPVAVECGTAHHGKARVTEEHDCSIPARVHVQAVCRRYDLRTPSPWKKMQGS